MMKIDYKTFSDERLAELLSQCDNLAFDEIYNRYWFNLYNHAVKLLKHTGRAEDLVQDIFMNLFKIRSEFNTAKPLKAYLFKSVQNGVLSLHRSDNYRSEFELHFKRYNEEGYCTTDEYMRIKELEGLIEQGINDLPPKMRDMFEMSRKAYFSHKEIAESTGATAGTVKKQLHNAITKIRSKLSCLFFLLVMYIILDLHSFYKFIKPLINIYIKLSIVFLFSAS